MEMKISTRGRDSWGLTNGHRVLKMLGDIEDTGGPLLPDWVQDGDSVIVHTRGASAGSVVTANSHPFLVKGPEKTVCGVHNRCLYGWEELKKRYDMPDYAVDSNALYHMIAYDLPTAEVDGWGAMVWFEWGEDGS